MPSRDELPERVDAVLDVVHLVFTTGHAAPVGEQLVHRELVDGAIHLARTLRRLLPHDGDVAGLLALMLLTDARGTPGCPTPGSWFASLTRTARGGTGSRSRRARRCWRRSWPDDWRRSATQPGRDHIGHHPSGLSPATNPRCRSATS
jgi:uncharacterized protein DUF6596